MQHLSLFRFRSLLSLLAVPLALLASCADNKPEDPQPKPTSHTIQVRVTGTDLRDLDASVTVSTTLRVGTATTASGPYVFEQYASSVSQTYELGTFNNGDELYGEVRLAKVTPVDAVQPGPATVLKLEILSDGKVVETLKLDATKAGPKIETNPFLRGRTTLKVADL